MRELSAAAVQRAVAGMVIDANCRISPEVLRQLERCRAQEERPLAAAAAVAMSWLKSSGATCAGISWAMQCLLHTKAPQRLYAPYVLERRRGYIFTPAPCGWPPPCG